MNVATTVLVVVVAVLVVLALVALLARPLARRRHLRATFGPEYDRTVRTSPNRRAAEQELAERERRHAELTLRPLSPSARDNYRRSWMRAQEQFVDQPAYAVTEADRLLTALLADRGYPVHGYEQRLAYLSVEHANTLDRYRSAHDITVRHSQGNASTEDLRTAMVHYRALFDELLDASEQPGGEQHDHQRHDQQPPAGQLPGHPVPTQATRERFSGDLRPSPDRARAGRNA
ncbi:hypothetical protein [Goodfellowiella coeruleoviolacea]|uniref:Secreted protein n=1 Tax=Goodfellowiella coeruleoviolacea TaxID=334858 RepID=A0AAE3GJC3_9PSEU|nr:hypothetical protein [Goodfellowiella coeruleoviolacea]MCP2168369.1 hypothetical protein [Goodfellowiella coeruleoviolacea]